ncbi:hypothetical protein B296_00033289 [Ensete ventricosum]|uniref:Uncharacterized protein n=1 Tax=Ensete ventricosum TaxID=4639 RepID=A0A427A0N1_ENSVE|nr:hypothetical protein B296_00033289 [Ensete ventricosum]
MDGPGKWTATIEFDEVTTAKDPDPGKSPISTANRGDEPEEEWKRKVAGRHDRARRTRRLPRPWRRDLASKSRSRMSSAPPLLRLPLLHPSVFYFVCSSPGNGDKSDRKLLGSEIDAAEYEEKHQRYEALYSRRLRAKYFSKKALDGGTIKD